MTGHLRGKTPVKVGRRFKKLARRQSDKATALAKTGLARTKGIHAALDCANPSAPSAPCGRTFFPSRRYCISTAGQRVEHLFGVLFMMLHPSHASQPLANPAKFRIEPFNPRTNAPLQSGLFCVFDDVHRGKPAVAKVNGRKWPTVESLQRVRDTGQGFVCQNRRSELLGVVCGAIAQKGHA